MVIEKYFQYFHSIEKSLYLSTLKIITSMIGHTKNVKKLLENLRILY
jgi:hypothetical protein